MTPTATTLAALTSTYIASSSAPNANGMTQKLSNDLKTGKVCKFITDTQTQIGATLTQQQANDLTYWAHILNPTC